MIENLRNIFWVVLFALPVFLSAQDKELSDKEQRKFDYYFYEALRFKQIERFDLALQALEECFKIDESNATVPYEMGRIFVLKKDAQNAQLYLKEAYKLDPNNKWVALELGDFYQKIVF